MSLRNCSEFPGADDGVNNKTKAGILSCCITVIRRKQPRVVVIVGFDD